MLMDSNIDIKSIVNIKPLGTNVCAYTWDETPTGSNSITRKTYNILTCICSHTNKKYLIFQS